MKTVKLALAVSAIALTAGLAAPAHATYWNPTTWNGGYASVKGGFNSIEDNHGVNLDTGYSLDAALGYHYAPQLRFEGEVGFQSANGNGRSEIGSLTLMANGYYDFNNLGSWSTVFTPYLGLGLGAAHHELSVNGGGNSEWAFAYQATAGASYALTKQMAITAEYRYLGTTEIDTVPSRFEYNSHNFLAGLRYGF